MARAYYQKLSERFRNFYYGELARRRLREIKSDDDPPHYALLDRVPAISAGTSITTTEPPTDNLRYQKAQLLENGALVDFAVRELQAAGNEDKGNWVAAETARLYQDAGRYDGAIQVFKRAVPNYFAVDLPTLPRSYWEALFPKPYWTDLKKFSSQNALDPYLVASLIRQESEFNPGAVSRANAVGLMQLLPKVGKRGGQAGKAETFFSDAIVHSRRSICNWARAISARWWTSSAPSSTPWLPTTPARTGWTTGWDRESIAIRRSSWNQFRSPRPGSTCRPFSAMPMCTGSCTERRSCSRSFPPNRCEVARLSS